MLEKALHEKICVSRIPFQKPSVDMDM